MASPVSSPPNAQPPSTVFIISAIGLGVLAVIINVIWASSVMTSSQEASFKLCIVLKTVKPNDRFEANDYQILSVPAKYGEPFRKMGALTPEQVQHYAAEHRIFCTNVNQNDILRSSAFDPEEARKLQTPPGTGMAFISIKINDVNTPATLRPGGVADILAFFITPESKVPKAMKVKPHVKLIAIGSVTEERSSAGQQVGHYRTVTIEIPDSEQTTWMQIEQAAVAQYFYIQERRVDDTDYGKDIINPQVIDLLPSNNPGRIVPRMPGRIGPP